MTVTPAERAARAAAVAVATGISNCSNNTSQSATSLRNTAGSSVSPLLAPGATTMMFSPAESTMTTAVPLRPDTVISPSVPTPLALRWSRNCAADGSSPTAPTNCTWAPARAAATA